MKKQLLWGRESRHCVHCGKVGPRIHLGLGWSHKYCLTKEDKVRLKQLAEVGHRK